MKGRLEASISWSPWAAVSRALLAAIRTRKFEISAVRVEVTGTLDESPERFCEFTLSVSAACGDLELLRKAVLIAERACQVVNTLKLAAPVIVTVQEAQPI